MVLCFISVYEEFYWISPLDTSTIRVVKKQDDNMRTAGLNIAQQALEE